MGDTKQLTREQKQIQSNFQSLEKAVSSHKMMDMQSYAVDAVQKETVFQKQRNASLGRQGLALIPAQESRLVGQQVEDYPILKNEAVIAEKEHRKKRDQRRDAATRAKAEGYTFTAERLDPRGTVKIALKNALQAAETPDASGPLAEYDSIHGFESPMESLTFSAGPREQHFIEMLGVRNKLAIYLERAPKELTDPDADLILAQKRDLYQKLEEALQTYYTAYGVDYKTGQDVNRKTAQKARQYLALAFENFQDAFYNQADDLAEARLNKMRKDETFQQQLRNDTEADMAQMKRDGLPQGTVVHAGSVEHTALMAIRDRIAENPERYSKQKKLINQLFAEMTNCANTMSSIDRQMALADRMLTDANDTSASAEALRLTVAPNRRYGRRKNVLSLQLNRLEAAMNYLLTGQEPESFSESLFLKNRCNVETAIYTAVTAAPRSRTAQAKAAQTPQTPQTQTVQATQKVQTAQVTQEVQAQEVQAGPQSQTVENEMQKEKASTALEEDIARYTKASADALAEAERRAAEAGEENESAQIRLETMRALTAGSLSEKLLAASYDVSFEHALADHQFRQQKRRDQSRQGKTARNLALDRSTASLSLAAAPISVQGKGLYQEDRQAVMAECRARLNAFQKMTKNLRELYYDYDETYKEYNHAGFAEVDLPVENGIPITYDRFVTLRNYMEKIVRHKNKEPLDPAIVNEAREVEAQAVFSLKSEAYSRRYPEVDLDFDDNVNTDQRTKRLRKKFAYEENPTVVYSMKKELPEDISGVMRDYAAELSLYEAGKADIEAFVQEHTEAFKAAMTPQERMANYAVMDLLRQKAKALSSRISTFGHSPFYNNISNEEQQRFPDYRAYFRSIEEFVTLHARVIDSYGQSNVPAEWKEAELFAMSLSLSDFQEDYYRRISID